MRAKRNIALLGCGAWGKNHLRNWAEMGALAVVCDASPERLRFAQEQYPELETTQDVSAVLNRPDIEGVVIATPATTHADLALQFLHAGKDVFVEKPMALTAAEGKRVVEAAEANDRILMVGHVLVYHAAVRELNRLAHKGELGRIRYIYSNRLNLGKIRTEENSLWSFAPHDVALVFDLLGGTGPQSLTCVGGNYLNPDVADVTLTTLAFGGGVRAHIFVSWLHPFKEQRFVVVGDRQMAVFDDTLDWSEKLVLYPHKVDWMEGQVPVANKAEATPVALSPNEPLRAECEHFVDCIRTRETPLSGGTSALRVLQVLEAAQHSLDRGGEPIRGLTDGGETTAPDYFAHPTATIDEGANIGSDTRIWHYTHIMGGAVLGSGCNVGQNVFLGPKVRVGDGVKIQNNVSVYDGVTLEDDVFCGPSMVFTNVLTPRSAIEKKDQFRRTLVKRGASLGANCTIICGNTVGRHALVGAGAVVTSDVGDHAIVWGVPARQSGWACVCGETLVVENRQAACAACKLRFRLTDDETLEPIG
jgi:UDP-2-acetamido-3-amino-2,3-dideoxy-glucuronate N-acetyltransferase